MNKKKIIYLVILVLWLAFIWGNSFMNGPSSGRISGGITEKIYNILVNMNINIRIETLHLIIRKLAHATEYFILGFIMFLNVYQYLKEIRYYIGFSFGLSLLVSIIDETIQTFINGRSGSIVDIGIDAIGFSISITIMILITIHNNKKKEQVES